jgi:hypothetical protein
MKKGNNTEHQELYNAFMKEVASGGGYFKFPQGNTGFVPVYMEGEAPISSFGRTINVNKDGEKPRYVFYARIIDADDSDGLPENIEQLLPIFVSKRVAQSIGKTLAGSKMKKPSTFTSLSKEGQLTYGSLYIMERVGTGLETKYTLSVSDMEGYEDIPTTTDIPEKSIQDYADECTVQARERAANSPVNAPKPEKPENDFAGFK